LDITSDYTFQVIDGLIQEVAALFPDKYIHLGGDEVFTQCWGSMPAVTKWMQNNNYAQFINQTWVYNFTGLWGDAEVKIQAIGAKYNKTVILWEEAFDNNFHLLKDTAINVWLSAEKLEQIVVSGHQAIMGFGFYLDRQLPTCNNPGVTGGCPEDSYHWFFMDTWQDFYLNEPYAGLDNLTPEQLSLIVGAEANCWGENVDRATLDDRIWSRGGAVAERLWSPANITDLIEAAIRLSTFRCKLARRGVMSGPTTVDYCEWGMATGSTEDPADEIQDSNGWKYVAYGFIAVSVVLSVVVFLLIVKVRKNQGYSEIQ